MNSNYHIFKKTVKSGKKSAHKWYYYWLDPITGVMHQKVCKGCKTQSEAYAFVSKLPNLFSSHRLTINQIAKDMYIPGGSYVTRLESLGKHLELKTLKDKRIKLEIFLKEFGDMYLQDLTVPMVTNYLIRFENRSGSWKNNVLTVLSNIYDEAPFHGVNNVLKPQYPKFARNTRKKDIFTTEELNALFDEEVWERVCKYMYRRAPQYDEGYKDVFLLFLCSLCFGLRIGEAIGARAKQFMFDEHMFVVDGFFRHETKVRTNFNKKGSDADQKIRVVPMPDFLRDIMKDYITEKNIGPEDYVFTRYGLPVRKHLVEKWFKRALVEAGIETEGRHLSPHSLRFTYITRMRRMETGEMVRKLAGHTTMQMTDYYTRAGIPEMVQAVRPAVDAVNQLFK